MLAAARQLFGELGYDEVSVEAIAAAAGVSPGTVYNRFATKATIAASLLRHWMGVLDDGADGDVAAGLPAEVAIRNHFARLGRLIDAERALAEAFFVGVIEQGQRAKQATDPADPRLVLPIPRPLCQILAAAKDRGELRDGTDPDDLGRSATSFLTSRVLSRAEPAMASAAFVSDIVLHGTLR